MHNDSQGLDRSFLRPKANSVRSKILLNALPSNKAFYVLLAFPSKSLSAL